MNEVVFLRGSDVTVTADGTALGGVISVECAEETEWEHYGEVLSDIPAASFGRTVYKVRLALNAQPYGSLGLSPARLSLEYGDTCVLYTGCRVENIKCEILPRDTVRYIVTVAAQERSELHDGGRAVS